MVAKIQITGKINETTASKPEAFWHVLRHLTLQKDSWKIRSKDRFFLKNVSKPLFKKHLVFVPMRTSSRTPRRRLHVQHLLNRQTPREGTPLRIATSRSRSCSRDHNQTQVTGSNCSAGCPGKDPFPPYSVHPAGQTPPCKEHWSWGCRVGEPEPPHTGVGPE